MNSHPKFWRFFSCKSWNERVNKRPQHEGDDSVHRHVRMRHGEVGEVPNQIGKSECFHRSLKRTREVENNPDQIKRQSVARFQLIPSSIESEDEVSGTRNNRNHHSNARYDGYSLHPPRNRAENKMVTSDQCIK